MQKAHWNAAKGLAKGVNEDTQALNDYLEQYRSGIVAAYQEAVIQKKEPDT